MRDFVEYFDGRRFFTETETRLLTERSIDEALSLMPNYTYGFRFFTMADLVDSPPSVDGVEFVPSYTRQDQSGIYFPGGELLGLKQVEMLAKADPDQWRICYSNMRSNDMDHVVKTRSGNVVQFDTFKDTILPD